eukprot:GSA120T00015018001.1
MSVSRRSCKNEVVQCYQVSFFIGFKVRFQIFSSLKLSHNCLPGSCRALKEFTVGTVRLYYSSPFVNSSRVHDPKNCMTD